MQRLLRVARPLLYILGILLTIAIIYWVGLNFYLQFPRTQGDIQAVQITILLSATSLVALLLILWRVPKWQVSRPDLSTKERTELENSTRATLTQIFAGIFLLFGAFFTWQQIITTREGQITERFTRAIEHLGSEQLELRLGGIYALERIANDSQRDHWPIMEILTSFIRENASQADDQPLEVPQPRIDIQSALTVIGRRTYIYDPAFNPLARTSPQFNPAGSVL